MNELRKKKMVPENLKKKAEEILKNKNFSEVDGDKIEIIPKDSGLFYGYVKSQKRGSFGQIIINSADLSFLWGASAINPDVLLERFKAGVRSMPHQKKATRRNIRLPVINKDAEIINFANQLTEAFVSLFDEQDDDAQDLPEEKWRKMIYGALVLLLSAKEEDTKLIMVTMMYHSPMLVKTFLRNVRDREVYDYWVKEVPKFMKKDNAQWLVHCFDVRIASLIGEQEIQDLCNKYKK